MQLVWQSGLRPDETGSNPVRFAASSATNVELRAIPGYEGRYSASSDGRIWSHYFERWLLPYLTNGYQRVDLCVARKVMKARVHRLIALAWIQNPDGLPEINHLDGNKCNNAPANLEWCHRPRNIQHAYRAGLIKHGFIAGKHRLAKLSTEQVALIKARLARGERIVDLAAEFCVSQSCIDGIKSRGRWSHVVAAALP
jgi:hypothetical protein